MKCKSHTEKDADYICAQCSQPICEECRLSINGANVCKGCVEAGYNKKREGKMAAFFHFLCSLVPGAGQMQQGAMKRGVQIMLSFFTLGVISDMLNADELILFAAVIWFYSFFDSYHVRKAKRLNIEGWDKEFIKPEFIEKLVENKESKWTAWILIVVGIIALFNIMMNIGGRFFFNYHIFNLLRGSILPLLAIFLGWTILKKSKTIEIKTEEKTENQEASQA